MSEASQVAAPADLAEAPTTPDPSKAFYVQDENGNRAGDAEMRGIGGTPSQAISEPSEATKLIGPPEEPTTPGLTEALHSSDVEKARVAEILKSLERGAEVKRRRIGETSGQPLSRTSRASTLGSPQERSTPNSIETFKRKDTAKNRLVKFVKALKRSANAKSRGRSETLDEPHSPTELTTRTISLQEPSTADRSEAFHSKDKDRLVEILKALERSADPNRRGQSQTLSTQTKVRTAAESPAKPSSPDLADGFHSNDADKDRVVNVLKALMKRSRGLIADAPPLRQAEETDLAMTIPAMSDPVTPDKTRVRELELQDPEPERLAGSSGQDHVVGTEFSYHKSSATGQQTRAHTAFGTNQQSTPASPTDPGAEYPSRATIDTSAAPAAQPLHDASPRTPAPADDDALENASADKYHRRAGGTPPAVEAFMQRLAEYESSSLYQTTDGGDAVELTARSDDLNNTDQVPLADELYVAVEEQVTSEVPTVAAAPTAVEEPTAAKAQTAAEDPTAAEAPTSAEEPTAPEELATAEVPTTAEAPTKAEAQTLAEDRTAAKKPATAGVPTTAEAPSEVEAPTEAETRIEAEAPIRAEKPTGAEERTAAQERTAAEQQTTAEELTAAEEPATAEVPTTAKAPTEVEAPTEAEASTGAEEPTTAEEPTGGEEWTAAEEWIAAEQRTTADDAFDSVSAKPSSIPIVASDAWARPTPRSDDHMRWESVLRDTGLDDAGNATREDLVQGELAPQAISTIDEKPSVAERNQATEPSTFERYAGQDDAQSQEYGDGRLSATSETAAFADSPGERNDPDLAKAFFEVDVERAVAMARSELGLRDAGLAGGDFDPTEVFFAVDIERAVLRVRDELGEVTARADRDGAEGAADTRDPRAEIASTNMDRTLRTMLRELKKKPE